MNPFELPFMRLALAVGLLAGTALSALGVFTVARRVSFAGLAVSQLAALGTVVGLLLGLHFGAYLMALAVVAGGLWLQSWLGRGRRVPADAWTAALYVLAAALAVLILAKAPLGEAHTMSVFFGNVLSLSRVELWEAVGIFAGTVAVLGLWLPRWIWLSFDAVSPGVAGVKTGLWNAFFYGLLALVMTVSIHLFGVLLAFAYLLLPAVVGLSTARGTRGLLLITLACSAAATAAGFYASFRLDFPTGPFIAALLAAAALLAGVIGHARGGRA